MTRVSEFAAPIRIGIVGLGHIGRHHVEALGRLYELELVAACDLDPTLHALLPEGIGFYSSDEALLNDPGIDTVIIATPNRTHYPLARRALEAGKNVIVEKPAASSQAELTALIAMVSEGSQHLYFAFHAAKAFDVAWFVEHLSDPAERARLGPLTAFACQFHDPYLESGYVKQDAVGLENSWLDSGVNALSVLAEFLDLDDLAPVSTTAIRDEAEGVPVQCLVQYRFSTGRSRVGGIGTISTNWALDVNRKETRLGFGITGHEIVLDHSGQRVLESGPDRDRLVLQDFSPMGERLVNHYLGVFQDYVRCVRTGVFNVDRARRIHEHLFAAAP